jgi:hypothetical protein
MNVTDEPIRARSFVFVERRSQQRQIVVRIERVGEHDHVPLPVSEDD